MYHVETPFTRDYTLCPHKRLIQVHLNTSSGGEAEPRLKSLFWSHDIDSKVLLLNIFVKFNVSEPNFWFQNVLFKSKSVILASHTHTGSVSVVTWASAATTLTLAIIRWCWSSSVAIGWLCHMEVGAELWLAAGCIKAAFHESLDSLDFRYELWSPHFFSHPIIWLLSPHLGVGDLHPLCHQLWFLFSGVPPSSSWPTGPTVSTLGSLLPNGPVRSVMISLFHFYLRPWTDRPPHSRRDNSVKNIWGDSTWILVWTVDTTSFKPIINQSGHSCPCGGWDVIHLVSTDSSGAGGVSGDKEFSFSSDKNVEEWTFFVLELIKSPAAQQAGLVPAPASSRQGSVTYVFFFFFKICPLVIGTVAPWATISILFVENQTQSVLWHSHGAASANYGSVSCSRTPLSHAKPLPKTVTVQSPRLHLSLCWAFSRS